MERKHPVQPVIEDEFGTPRFKSNKIVEVLFNEGSFDLQGVANLVRRDNIDIDDLNQFYQLLGYSLEGAPVDDDTREVAKSMYEESRGEQDARLIYLSTLVDLLKDQLREPISILYDVHPDTLMEVTSRPVHNSATEEEEHQ